MIEGKRISSVGTSVNYCLELERGGGIVRRPLLVFHVFNAFIENRGFLHISKVIRELIAEPTRFLRRPSPFIQSGKKDKVSQARKAGSHSRFCGRDCASTRIANVCVI